ncbi:hypothetical protein AGMMS49949_08810 [Alphaproteobacteria bacterium]|nr:hypothetical protein AGMMS49949_08810 [Alphaproteobacteria bacterium]GHS95811.1 hypothetical protein AGMMS50296_1020 [Alphaproteobacteria bacterium]
MNVLGYSSSSNIRVQEPDGHVTKDTHVLKRVRLDEAKILFKDKTEVLLKNKDYVLLKSEGTWTRGKFIPYMEGLGYKVDLFILISSKNRIFRYDPSFSDSKDIFKHKGDRFEKEFRDEEEFFTIKEESICQSLLTSSTPTGESFVPQTLREVAKITDQSGEDSVCRSFKESEKTNIKRIPNDELLRTPVLKNRSRELVDKSVLLLQECLERESSERTGENDGEAPAISKQQPSSKSQGNVERTDSTPERGGRIPTYDGAQEREKDLDQEEGSVDDILFFSPTNSPENRKLELQIPNIQEQVKDVVLEAPGELVEPE